MNRIQLLLCLLTAACSAPRAPETDSAGPLVDQHLLQAAAAVQTAQADLYRAGAITLPTRAKRDVRSSEGKLYTLTWNGDAYQLLDEIASKHGMKLASTGVRLPLPVAVDVSGEPLDGLLDMLRAQVGYRATLEHSGELLRIRYNHPTSQVAP